VARKKSIIWTLF